MKKKFWPIFPRIFECEKPRGSKSKGPKFLKTQIFRHLMWKKLSDHFFGPKGSIETKLLKNSCFHRDNRFRPIFRRIIGGEKPQETLYRGPQATLTLTVEVVRWFLWDLRGC